MSLTPHFSGSFCTALSVPSVLMIHFLSAPLQQEVSLTGRDEMPASPGRKPFLSCSARPPRAVSRKFKVCVACRWPLLNLPALPTPAPPGSSHQRFYPEQEASAKRTHSSCLQTVSPLQEGAMSMASQGPGDPLLPPAEAFRDWMYLDQKEQSAFSGPVGWGAGH